MGARDSIYDEKVYKITAPLGTPPWLSFVVTTSHIGRYVQARFPAPGPAWEEVFRHHPAWDFGPIKAWREKRALWAQRSGVPAERDIVEQLSDDFIKQIRGEPFYPPYRAERLYEAATIYIVKPPGSSKNHLVGSIHGYYVKGETAVRDLFSTVKILHQGSPVWLADFKKMKLDRVLTLWELLAFGNPEKAPDGMKFVYDDKIGYIKIGRKTLWPVSEAQWAEGQLAPPELGGPEHVPGMYEEAPETIVVTRHKALLEYLREQNLVPPGARVIEHASPDDVRGKHVIGVLPLPLAALAVSVTEVPLNIPADLRGKELTLAQVRKYAGAPQRFRCGPHEASETHTAADYPDLEQALLGAQSKLDATHAVGAGPGMRIFSPTSHGYFVHKLERGGGSLHWFKAPAIDELPRDAKMIHELLRSTNLDPDVAPIPMRRAAEAPRKRVPITRIVAQQHKGGLWTAKVYDENGHLRSGVTVPSAREYIEKKMEEWFPGVPIEWVDTSAREEVKLSGKDPATMQPAEINKELDALQKKSSKLADVFIEQGRGSERFNETVVKARQGGDPLASDYVAIADRKQALHIEIELRYGPRAPSRLPRGFGPRRKVE